MSDERAVLDAVRMLQGCDEPDSFGARAMAAAKRLVSCDSVVWTEIDFARDRAAHETDDPALADGAARLAPVYERFLDENPLVAAARRDPAPVLKFSDFLTRAAFRGKGIHREFYGPLGIDAQIGVCLAMEPTFAAGVALNRSGRDFAERDRRKLAQFRPYLLEAHRSTCLVSDLKAALRRRDGALDEMSVGFVEVREDGRIVALNSEARACFEAAFPSRADRSGYLSGHLPEPVRRWFLAAGRGGPSAAEFPAPDGPLRARLLAGGDPGRFTLLLRREHAAGGAARLHRDGLTRREAEVLYRLTLGESNGQIAAALGMRPGTARIHIEHIFGKLKTPNRTAAAAIGLKWLGEFGPPA